MSWEKAPLWSPQGNLERKMTSISNPERHSGWYGLTGSSIFFWGKVIPSHVSSDLVHMEQVSEPHQRTQTSPCPRRQNKEPSTGRRWKLLTTQRHEDLVLKKQLLKKRVHFCMQPHSFGWMSQQYCSSWDEKGRCRTVTSLQRQSCSNLGFTIICSFCEYLRTIKQKSKHHVAKMTSTLGSLDSPLPLLQFLVSGGCSVRKSLCADSEVYNNSLELFHGAEAEQNARGSNISQYLVTLRTMG